MPLQRLEWAADVGVHFIGEGEDGLDLIVGDVIDCNEIAAQEVYGHCTPPATRSATLEGAWAPSSTTSSRPSHLFQADLDCLVEGGGYVLADEVCADGEFPVSPVDEHQELH